MFVSFEGIDGTGKTTQIELLKTRLESKGYPVLVTREPGGTPVAESIRDIILRDWEEELFGETELFLYAAGRCQHLRNVIKPALSQGKFVITDRFVDSSVVYQGIGRGLGKELVEEINRMVIDDTLPDITFILDLDIEETDRRISGRLQDADRLEKESLRFVRDIRQGYLELARTESQRCHIVDAARSPDEISREIWRTISRYL